jgi:multidrug resistance efflux pump
VNELPRSESDSLTGSAPAGLPSRAETLEPSSSLFQERAVEAYAKGEDAAALLDVAPRSLAWTVTSIVALLLACAVLMVVLEIEVIARANGVLASRLEPRMVSAQIAGTVAEVHVHSGDRVRSGDVLVSLDATALRSQLVEAHRALTNSEEKLSWLEGSQRDLFERQRQNLDDRVRLLLSRAGVEARAMAVVKGRVRRSEALTRAGVGTVDDKDAAYEQLYRLSAASADVRSQVAQIESQRLELERSRDTEVNLARSAQKDAKARMDALGVLLEQAVIRAPHDGVVESLLTHAGELLHEAAVVARVVPAEAPERVVLFLDQKDRGFVHRGTRTRFEVDGLPAGEFGRFGGRVERIASYPATAFEMAEAMGAPATDGVVRYRIDVSIERDERFIASSTRLRSGTGVRATLELRRRPIWSLIANAMAKE